MPKVALYNIKGEQIDTIELADAVFGIEPNEAVVHEAVVMQLASLPVVLSLPDWGRGQGGGRKPWSENRQG